MFEFNYEHSFKTADINGTRLYYLDTCGKGPAIIFLHAASGNSSLWEKQYIPFLTSGYRIIAYDRAGQGRSTRTGDSKTITKPELEQLMDFLGIQHFHLLGVAAGGGVALQYTLIYPQRVLSLILANSIGNVQDPEYIALGQRLRPPAFNNLPLELRELGPSYRASNPEGVQHWLELSTQRQDIPKVGTEKPHVRSSGEMEVTFTAMRRLTVPVLLLTGDADLYMPPSALRLFKQHIPTAEMEIIQECGHASYWENPDVFNHIVLDFLKRH
jgi:pimeloyl-ACP methyl ester carboxylesterase